jgi:hypothetical protein
MTWRDKASRICLAIAILAFFYICTFKILDRDYWWHVKAGEIMSATHKLISVEPFAYTRAGQPYVSTHEWLAQVIIYGVYHVAGPTGQILLRGLLVAAAFTLLLLIDRKSIWPNIAVVLWAAYTNRPSFMDRPQLFTFALFACVLWAAFWYLEKSRLSDELKWPVWRWQLVAGLTIVQILWVNLHGAAAVYGVVVLAAQFGQRVVEWFAATSESERLKATREMRFLGIVLGLLAVASVITPNGLGTFKDIFVYSHDQALAFVREWQPRGAASYALELGPFWVIAAACLWLGKRHTFFSCALLAVTGYLSFQAYRHGIIFILAALGISIYQLKNSAAYQKRLDFLAAKRPWTAVGSAAVLLLLAWQAHAHDISEIQREGLSGWGAAPVAEDGYNFIERAKLQGNMFNTYAIGDYLLFRGYPKRKVFVDGRTVDYGYDFIYQTGSAGFNPDVWKQLDEKYKFSYAIIEYPLAPGAQPQDGLPYTDHLDKNPDWKLVYIDDWTAVYVKDSPENKDIIATYQYKHITPSKIEFDNVFTSDMSKDDAAAAEKELQRAASDSARSIKPRLLLAHHLSDEGRYDEAFAIAQQAQAGQAYRPEVYEALGQAAAGQERWAAAADFFEKSIALTGGVGLPINYEYLASVYSKIGDTDKASYYHQKALKQK